MITVAFFDDRTCERCIKVKEAFLELTDIDDAIEQTSKDSGKNTVNSEWMFCERVADGLQAKLWKPSLVMRNNTNDQVMEMTYIFLTEGEYQTFFFADCSKINESRKGTLLDFNDKEMKGVLLKPSPTIKAQIDLRALLNPDLPPNDRIAHFELDNSINAFRRIILRKGQGALKSTYSMTPETEIRESQAERTYKWLVEDEQSKRLQDTFDIYL